MQPPAPPLVCSHWPQALKTAPRLIDQEHNKEAAEAASAELSAYVCVCTDQEAENNKMLLIKPLEIHEMILISLVFHTPLEIYVYDAGQ